MDSKNRTNIQRGESKRNGDLVFSSLQPVSQATLGLPYFLSFIPPMALTLVNTGSKTVSLKWQNLLGF